MSLLFPQKILLAPVPLLLILFFFSSGSVLSKCQFRIWHHHRGTVLVNTSFLQPSRPACQRKQLPLNWHFDIIPLTLSVYIFQTGLSTVCLFFIFGASSWETRVWSDEAILPIGALSPSVCVNILSLPLYKQLCLRFPVIFLAKICFL